MAMKVINTCLDKFVRPEIHLLHMPRLAFHVCGYVGLLAAGVLAMSLVMALGLKPTVIAAIIFAAVLTFLGVVMATKIITGEEEIVYYHHEIAVMIAAALVLR